MRRRSIAQSEPSDAPPDGGHRSHWYAKVGSARPGARGGGQRLTLGGAARDRRLCGVRRGGLLPRGAPSARARRARRDADEHYRDPALRSDARHGTENRSHRSSFCRGRRCRFCSKRALSARDVDAPAGTARGPRPSGDELDAGCPTGRRRRSASRPGSPSRRPTGRRSRAPRAARRAARARGRRDPERRMRLRRRDEALGDPDVQLLAADAEPDAAARGETRAASRSPRARAARRRSARLRPRSPPARRPGRGRARRSARVIGEQLDAPRDPGPEKRTRFSRWVPCRIPVTPSSGPGLPSCCRWFTLRARGHAQRRAGPSLLASPARGHWRVA